MSERETLPPRRHCETMELTHGGQNTRFSVNVGFYNDGRIGEVFVSGAKAGSEVEAVARDAAVLLSLALQYGTPLDTIKHALTRDPDGKPATIMGRVVEEIASWPKVPFASSR